MMDETGNHAEGMKAFFDRRAKTWDDSCGHNPEKIAAIVTLAGVTVGARVADVACGTGVLFSEILSRTPEFLLGIDLSDKMIDKARLRSSDPRLHLMASDCFDVNESGFDTVLIYNAYPHFLDKVKLAEHMAEMLRAGGRIMIAHSESKDAVNSRHSKKMASHLFSILESAKEESSKFSKAFYIDMTADTDNIYFFSGTKK
jgi:2-polyprenyl-3-methyl-5-hydroxy-6-metoxy-1,4-benzoquinol methylase